MADWSRQCRGADHKDLLIQIVKVTPKMMKRQRKRQDSTVTSQPGWENTSNVHASVHST